MSKLDQFFRKKLSDREFSFDDEAWKEMDELLDSEKRKPRYGWIWGLALVVFLGLGWLIREQMYIKDWSGKEVSNNLPNEEDASGLNEQLINGDAPSGAMMKEGVESTKKTDLEFESDNVVEEVKNEDKSEKSELHKNGVNEFNDADLRSGMLKEETSKRKEQLKTDLAILKMATEENENTKTTIKSGEGLNENGGTAIIVNEEKDNENIELKKSSVGLTSEVKGSEEKLFANRGIQNLQAIPLLNTIIYKAVRNLNDSEKLPGKPLAFYNYKTWKLGVFAEQTLFIPFNNNQNVSVSSIGLMAQFELNKKWNLQTGIHYQFLNTNALPQDTLVNNVYSFGLQEQTSATAINALQYLGGQGLLVRKFNLFEMAIGLEFNINIAANGTLKTNQSVFPFEDNSIEAIDDQKGILKTDRVNRLIFLPQLKLSYTVARNTALSVGVKYQLNEFIKSNAVTSMPAWNSNALQMKMGLNYYFFTQKKKINER